MYVYRFLRKVSFTEKTDQNYTFQGKFSDLHNSWPNKTKQESKKHFQNSWGQRNVFTIWVKNVN